MNFLQRFQYARDSYVVTALVIGIAVLVNVVAVRHFWRWDLTRNQIYALSPASKAIVQNLDDVVTVKIYFSETLPPNLFAVRQYVDDVLEELSSYSKGHLAIRSINPDAPEGASEALKAGIPQVQFNVFEKDKLEVRNGFLGIGVWYGERKEVLPVVQAPDKVEYDVVAAIKKVTTDTPKTVGVATGHDEPPLSENIGVGLVGESYSVLKKALDRNYQVKEVNLDGRDALASVNTLLIAGPRKPFSERELFSIDQFLMEGGNVVALLDSHAVGQDLQTFPFDNIALASQFKTYGASLEPSLALDRSNESASFSQGFMNFITPYPFWVKAVKSFFDPRNPMVSPLESLVFPWPSPLIVSAPEGVSADFLVKTTMGAWTQSPPFVLEPTAIQAPANRAQYPLAVLLKGTFPSAFKEKTNPFGAHDFLRASSKPGQLLLVGNSRFALDRFLALFPQNLPFLLNAIDDLTLDQSLIAVRSRQSFDPPLRELSDRERKVARGVGIFFAPFILLLYGALRYWARKQEKVLTC